MTTLFYGQRMYDYFEKRKERARKMLDGWPASLIESGSEEELVEQLVEAARIRPIVLDFDCRYMDEPVEMPVSGSDILGGRTTARGTAVCVRIPFTGEKELFKVSPAHSGPPRPSGEVEGEEVVLRWIGRVEDVGMIAPELDRELASLRTYAGWSHSGCTDFNATLRRQAAGWIRERRAHLGKNRELVETLGLPLRKDRSTQLVPVERRTPVTETPKPAAGPKEAAVSEEVYAAIIAQLSTARHLIERLPETFSPMGEEALRDLLLVILNNQFGPAGGEVFSRKGKTDILIHHGQGAVFIAECKNWPGPARFRRAIDQLLGYLVWRDTKAALVVFVRENDVTGITEKAKAALVEHPQRVREGEPLGELPTFIFHHKGDEGRHIRVALLIVPIPPVA